MRSPKPGVQRRLKWNWSRDDIDLDSETAVILTVVGVFVTIFGPIIAACTGPQRQDGNPLWTHAHVVWFVISCLPAIGVLIALTGYCATKATKWLIKNPPIRMTEESPDLREIYRDSKLPPPSDVPAIRVMPSKKWK